MRFVKCKTPTSADRALILSDDEILEILSWLDIFFQTDVYREFPSKVLNNMHHIFYSWYLSECEVDEDV